MFPAVVALSVVFVVTILAFVVLILGEPKAPLARWLNRHATTLIVAEVAGILTTGFLALVVDRRQTLRAARHAGDGEPPQPTPKTAEPPPGA